MWTKKRGDVVEEMLRTSFPGRLATYSMGFGEIVSTADKSSAGSQGPEGSEANEDESDSEVGEESSPQAIE